MVKAMTDLEDDGQYVRVQRWVVRLAVHLLLFLAIGAASSIGLLVTWMIVINRSTNDIKEHQVANRKIIEDNQKLIMENQKAILKVVEKK
jgi:hypothetical protein